MHTERNQCRREQSDERDFSLSSSTCTGLITAPLSSRTNCASLFSLKFCPSALLDVRFKHNAESSKCAVHASICLRLSGAVLKQHFILQNHWRVPAAKHSCVRRVGLCWHYSTGLTVPAWLSADGESAVSSNPHQGLRKHQCCLCCGSWLTLFLTVSN